MAKKIEVVKPSTLAKAANILANAIRQFAPYNAIRKSVKVGKPTTTKGGNNTIVVTVGNKNVPYARAFDIGSGIHSQKGRKGTYKIKPRNYWALGIPRKRWKNFTFPAGGVVYNEKTKKFLLPEVDHPGVVGINYTDRAKKSVRKEITQLVKMEAIQSIRTYLKAEFLGINNQLRK